MGSAFISDAYVDKYYEAALQQKSKTALKTRNQIWLSQPREKSNKTVEILTYSFASKAPISSISFDTYSVGAEYEFWYYDSNNARLPLIRDNYQQVLFDVESKTSWTDWMHWDIDVMPCVATKLEIRMHRIADENAPSSGYSLAVRKLAIRRQVVTRQDAALPLRPSKDILGNTIAKTVRDWQPSMMIDNDTYTFWKSEPQVAQDAVVCLYADIRDKYGQPQYFDSLDIDPVYAGSQMNVYWSSDDTIGDREPPMTAYDAEWQDADWSSKTEDDQNEIGHWSMQKPTSSMTFDMNQTEIDRSGSWMVGIAWRPVLPFVETESVICSISSNFKVIRKDKTLQFWYQNKAGMQHVDLDLPAEIQYYRGLPRDKQRDTEVRLDFGMDRSAEEVLRIRCRVIVKNYDTNEILEDKTDEKVLRTAIQLSMIAGSIPRDFEMTASDEPVRPQLVNAGTEIVIPSQTSYDIPLKDVISDIEPDSSSYDIEVMLSYRTEQDYVNGARVEIWNGDANSNQSWWTDTENRSPSKLSVNDKSAYTNWFDNPSFSTAGRWQPDKVEGSGTAVLDKNKLVLTGSVRARNVEKVSTEIKPGRYVFTAIPTFTDVSWYKDYGLYVFDGSTNEFVAFSSKPVKPGERVVLEFTTPPTTRLLSYGFVGGSTNQTVSWSQAGLFSADDWRKMQEDGLSWFDGNTAYTDSMQLPRYCQELILNPTSHKDKPAIGQISWPSEIDGVDFMHRPFDGDVALLQPYLNRYDVDNWLALKAASCIGIEFYVKSVNGLPDVQPVIIDATGSLYWPDRYVKNEKDNGWWKVYARVTVPYDHVAEMMAIGLYEKSTYAHTFVGDFHAYDNADAFEKRDEYNVIVLSKHVDEPMTDEELNKVTVRVSNSSLADIFISACSVKASTSPVQDMSGDSSYIGNINGKLEAFVFKQSSLPALDQDKFIQNPYSYVSPDAYDMSSTLADALVYGNFKDEQVLRGGVSDSIYSEKEWWPLMTGQKLAKQKYIASTPVEAKFIKIELTQLTAVQYPIESAAAMTTYRVFPPEVTAEMIARMQVDDTIKNNRQPDIDGYNNLLSDNKLNYYQTTDLDNQTAAYNAQQQLYKTDNNAEVLSVKDPNYWLPQDAGDVATSERDELTNDAIYTGEAAQTISSLQVRSKLSLLAEMNAQYQMYTAQASDTLIALSREYGLEDWKVLLDDNGYIQDTSDKTASSGRIPGYWIFPGQQRTYSIYNMKQITSTSRTDVVQKTSLKQAVTTVQDSRSAKPVLNVVGPKFFSKPMKHYYETRKARRTQSVAYFAAIRELKIGLIDYLQQRDNVTWDFYTLGSSPWHLNGGHMTTDNIFVPDFSTGASVAVAETDVMHSQSFYRTVKLLSVNRDSLTNRTYFNFDSEPWHDSGYYDKYEWLNCVWDDSTPDNPDVYEDNGGAWDSNRFAWGDTWTGTIVPGKDWEVWYDGELVKHLVVNPEDRVFDANGKQQPFRYKLGELMVPSNSMVTLGTSLFSLKKANPNNPNQHLETRLQLVSGKYSNSYLIDEQIGFDDTLLSAWQDFQTSRQHLMDTTYTCEVWLYFNNFEQLDVYFKSAYIETGTMRVLMKNVESLDWEDVTSAIGRTDSQYTFKTAGRDMQIRIECTDAQDWFGQLIVVPIYIPQEDAIDWDAKPVHEVRIVQSDGSDIQLTGRVGAVFNVAVRVFYSTGLSELKDQNIEFKSADSTTITFMPDPNDDTKTQMRFLKAGKCEVYAWYGGTQSAKYLIDVTY